MYIYERVSNLNNKIKNIKELHKGDFISLYDLEYKNKLNQDKHWSVATRKDKEALEGFYLKNKDIDIRVYNRNTIKNNINFESYDIDKACRYLENIYTSLLDEMEE